ncbi:MAG: SIMPL domain-containing protein [Nitrososphaerales archaeon]
MAENKLIYAITIAIFAGLALVAASNFTTQNTSTRNSDSEAFAQTTIGIRQNIISVTGTASKDIAPDQVVINFGVETQATTAAEASQKNADAMNGVVKAVKDLGITDKEISTSRFNIWPNYDTSGRVITGYTASNIITVKTSQLTKSSQIIDAAVSSGTNRVESIFFTLSNELDKKVRDELTADAVKDAKMKAENALAPLEKQIIGVKSVSLSEFGMPLPIQFDRLAGKAEGAGPQTPIFNTEQEVSTTVSVIFLID